MGGEEGGGGGGRDSGDRLPTVTPVSLALQDDEEVSEFALDGLKQVMAVKSRVVLPYLVPKVHPTHTAYTPIPGLPGHVQMLGLTKQMQ